MLEDIPPEESAAIAAAVPRAWRDAAAGHPRAARPRAPLPVRRLDGRVDHWFVPVTAGNRLVAFLRFTRGGVLHGTSSFLRAPHRLQDAPAAHDWLDRTVVRTRAAALAEAGEVAGEPLLSFDGSPERLAWAVPLDSAQGRRWAFVAGHVAWLQAR